MLFFIFCFSITEISAQTQTDKQEVAVILQSADNLMHENRYQEAADMLERFLMTGTATDDVVEVYQYVLNHIDQKIASYSAQIQLNTQWQTHGKLSVNVGGGDNLNRAPSEKNITFTGATESTSLSEDDQPKAGYGVETNASIWTGKQLSDSTKVNLALQMQHRATDQEDFTDYLQINSSANLQHKLANKNELGVALFAEVLQYDNESRFYALDVLTRYAWQINQSCRSQAGVDLQWKHQKHNRLFDSFYMGAASTTNCFWFGGVNTLGVSAGNEWALDQQRPGGGQWRVRIQLAHEREANWLKQKDQVSLNINLDNVYDQQGYDSLIENNKKRVMQRLAIGTKYRIPIIQGHYPWWGVIRLEWQKQYSNIELFEFQSFELWGGIEVQW